MTEIEELRSIVQGLRNTLAYRATYEGLVGIQKAPSKAYKDQKMSNVFAEKQGLKLKTIADENRDCKACKLGLLGCQSFVFGSGCSAASVIWVGEGPGEDEDTQGKPFVGESGQLLTKMMEGMVGEAYRRLKDPEQKGVDFDALLKAHVFKRDNCYIANIVKHRPPENRKPEPDEIAACLPILKDQIAALADTLQVIICLGATAAQSLLGTQIGIGKLRGDWYDYRVTNTKTVPLMATYHPAYLLPGRNPGAKPQVWDDLKAVITKVIGR